jgi:gliding motility-associated-like protein
MKRLINLFCIVFLVGLASQADAQINTLTFPDTTCVLQDVFLSSTDSNGAEYYWGTCSAWLQRAPKGRIVAAGAPLNGPTPVKLTKEGNNNILFTVNYDSTWTLVRCDFGSSLGNYPTLTNLGNFGYAIPKSCTGIDIVNERGNYFMFLVGGIGVNTQITRLDFGTSLMNIPTATDMGNLGGQLISPHDIHMFNEAGNWHGLFVNAFNNRLERFDFGINITSVPTLTNLGNPGGLAFPMTFRVVEQAGSKYAFVLNRLTNSLRRLDFGTSLLNVPVVFNLGTFGGIFDSPRDINFIFDDNRWFGFVTNEGTNDIVRLRFGNNITNFPNATNLGNFANFNGPRGITQLVREKDNVYGFVTNYGVHSISQIHFDSSANATILKNTNTTMPVYYYTTPGVYNVYVRIVDTNGNVNEEQHRITVLPKPRIDLTGDTLMCQGDTLFMVANGQRLSKILWEPTYNLLYQNDTNTVFVYPEEDYTYHVNMQYEYGCIIDTYINISVSKIRADAGPDRTIADGAETQLGGPYMTEGTQFKYEWTPNLYMEGNNNTVPFPNVRLLDTNQAYFLKVTNTDGCVDRDTVFVKTYCGEINCPNAFNPTGYDVQNRTFGIANYQLSKLDYFRIFNRWGELVFETNNPRLAWDGTYNGNMQSTGTYIWMAEGICENGRKVKRNGNVLLVR